MSDYVPLKYYFDQALAIRLADSIQPYYHSFNRKAIIEFVTREVENKELKARVEVITDALKQHLPSDYEAALAILLQILGPENKTEEGMFTKGYFLMPVAFYVEKYGLDHYDLSFQAMYEITKRHTSEYAIRPYLIANTDHCMTYFRDWVTDPNPHVRRLVSEGTRPRLPWAKKMPPLKNNIENNLRLLENLLHDSSSYVQKSVANHLNDLTKENPEKVLLWVHQIMENNLDVNPKIIKNGLRTLVKLKNEQSLELLRQVK
ncbi:3-methyladenine DNA glycosylase AlkC [Gracilibacillus orientalis]|uniref:3-methyladenine DNA glycosylase AlkC n=1 Tax=Gracilibacillus orientalis TaxID=334253 RepID=A0A1I4LN33_9BACI|nr:DNA alkylation repair protein [Gracilibacillus orientalis]SFL92360.1 3-methyladenine DNA glycosylase AlkC [Gracilibacillus orientalis]